MNNLHSRLAKLEQQTIEPKAAGQVIIYDADTGKPQTTTAGSVQVWIPDNGRGNDAERTT